MSTKSKLEERYKLLLQYHKKNLERIQELEERVSILEKVAHGKE